MARTRKKTSRKGLELVAYCGLYCGLCSSRNRIPAQAQALKGAMQKEGWEYWGGEFPGFKEFWPFLSRLADPDKSCPGCREGGGPPFCGIRKCARARKVDLCVDCPDWPCQRIDGLAKGYVMLIADGLRLKRIGFSKWLKEQKERQETGFCYSDIRCHPYTVPDK